jgi:hypothetical protein
VVDHTGEDICADKIGLILSRDLSALHPTATLVVDVRSTGLYKTDPPDPWTSMPVSARGGWMICKTEPGPSSSGTGFVFRGAKVADPAMVP